MRDLALNDLTLMRRAGGGGGPLTGILIGQPLRLYVESLDSTSVTGRQSTATLKVPGIDPMPTGMVYSATGTGNGVPSVTIGSTFEGEGGSTDRTLRDWDFRDHRVVLGPGSDVHLITDCLFCGGLTGNAHYPIIVSTTGRLRHLTRSTLEIPRNGKGPGVAINFDIGGTLTAPVVGALERISFCRFGGGPADTIKACIGTLGMVIEDCYFASSAGVEFVYSAGATYTLGQRVAFNNFAYECLVASSTGVAPTGAQTDNANWGWRDPHVDAITVVVNNSFLTIRRCRGEGGILPNGSPDPLTIGQTTWLRAERNTGFNYICKEVNVVDSVLRVSTVAFGGGLSDGTNYEGPVRVTNCAVTAGTPMTGMVYDEAVLYNAATDALIDISPTVLRGTVRAVTGARASSTSLNASITIRSNDGTLHAVVTSSATQPTAAQIIAGQNHLGVAAHAALSRPITGTVGGDRVETWTATGLPADGTVYIHVCYDRTIRDPDYQFRRSSGAVELLAITYAQRAAAAEAFVNGPILASGVHSVTGRMRFKLPAASTQSAAALYYHVTAAGDIVFKIDTRATQRRVAIDHRDGAGANNLGIQSAIGSIVLGNDVDALWSVTQNQDGGNRGARLWLDGVLVATLTHTSGSTTFRSTGLQRVLHTDLFQFDIYSFDLWHNQFATTADIAALGTPTVGITGAATLWNGTGLPSGWTKAGTGSFT